jgi:hypothetical protein
MLVAKRRLYVRLGGSDVALEVRLFKPEFESGVSSCRYEIDWPSGTQKSRAAGVDSVQAIILALQKIGVALYTSEYHRNAQISWLEAENGYGFPVPSNARDLLVGEDLDI